jgi:hypothetical protein
MGKFMSERKDLGKSKTVTRSRRSRAHRLLARSRLSENKIRAVIRSYTERKSVAETASATGVSHVTVGRIFHLIRERMFTVGLFWSRQLYLQRQADYEDEDEGDMGYFDFAGFDKKLAAFLGESRGINDKNRALYEAEAVYWLTTYQLRPGDLESLILKAIADSGPLGDFDPEAPRVKIFLELARQTQAKFIMALDETYGAKHNQHMMDDEWRERLKQLKKTIRDT